MKAKIHPKYNDCQVKCACGATFTTRSTASELKVDVCSSCHPFYTGMQKFLDSAGRVEKFGKKYNWDESARENIQKAAKSKRRKGKLEKVEVGLPSFKRKEGEEASAGETRREAAKKDLADDRPPSAEAAKAAEAAETERAKARGDAPEPTTESTGS